MILTTIRSGSPARQIIDRDLGLAADQGLKDLLAAADAFMGGKNCG